MRPNTALTGRGPAATLILALTVLLVSAWLLLPAARAEPVVEARLDNGLRVLVKSDRRAPTAVQLLAYRVGSVDESNGITGISTCSNT